jgi:hypothetical protein
MSGIDSDTKPIEFALAMIALKDEFPKVFAASHPHTRRRRSGARGAAIRRLAPAAGLRQGQQAACSSRLRVVSMGVEGRLGDTDGEHRRLRHSGAESVWARVLFYRRTD